MKITIVLLLSACLAANAEGISQTVSLSEKNASLEKVFKEIKRQTGYVFFFDETQMQRAEKVTVNVHNAAIENVLELCFKNQPLTYYIVEKTIVIKPKADFPSEQKLPALIDITGRVVDENGAPVLATVTVKGTNQGTSTDSEGTFQLKGVDENAILVITGVNIETREIKVLGKTNITVSTKIKIAEGGEVLIKAGYYNIKKREATGNIARVSSKEIEIQPVSNTLAALQGRVAGLEIIQQTGVPEGNFKVRIRGINSIANGNDPLFIVDGVPFTSTSMSFPHNTFDLFLNGTSPLNGINPSDIESIEVLKDADATAIYGSRGSNGVVLITTKKGIVGKFKVDANIRVGGGNPASKMELMKTPQFREMLREAHTNDGTPITPATDPVLTLWDSTVSTDWQKELLHNTASLIDAQVSMSGGDKYSQYIFGIGYRRESSVFPGDNSDQRFSTHINLSNRSKNEKLSNTLSINYSVNLSDLIKKDLTALAMTLQPNIPPAYKDNGDLNWDNYGDNPMSYLKTDYESTTKNLIVSSVPKYAILKNLDVLANLGYTDISTNSVTTTPLSSLSPAVAAFSENRSDFSSANFTNWTVEPQVNWRPRLGNSQFNFLFGASFLEQVEQGIAQGALGFVDESLMKNIGAAASIATSSNYYSQYRYHAFFGRINYELSKKYFFNLTGRRDGSSRFGPGKQFANFGAIGAGWLFSEEKIIKDALSFLSFGKLRISYGLTGNDQLQNYQYLDTYTPSGTYQGANTLRPVRLANPNFAWETNKKFEAGLELSFIQNRIETSVSYYKNKSSNQLVGFSLPPTTGFTLIQGNLPAVVQNTGWEIVLSTQNIREKKFNWTTSFNITVPKNKLLEFPNLEASPSYANVLVVGQPLSIFMRYQYTQVDPQSGIYQFEDINKDGFVNSLDMKVPVFIGQTYYGGLNNSFQIGAITLDILFQFSKQTKPSFMSTYGSTPGQMASNQPEFVRDPWRKPGDLTTYQKFSQSTIAQQAYNNFMSSTAAITNGSYVRLKNLNVSYHVPAKWIDALKIKYAQVFLQAQNLLTITGYEGLDPETSGFTLPPLRMIVGGVNVSF